MVVTVLGCGPIAAYCCYCLIKNNPAYHFWAVVLSVAELYGGFMTFCPEWLTGNKVRAIISHTLSHFYEAAEAETDFFAVPQWLKLLVLIRLPLLYES